LLFDICLYKSVKTTAKLYLVLYIQPPRDTRGNYVRRVGRLSAVFRYLFALHSHTNIWRRKIIDTRYMRKHIISHLKNYSRTCLSSAIQATVSRRTYIRINFIWHQLYPQHWWGINLNTKYLYTIFTQHGNRIKKTSNRLFLTAKAAAQ